MTNKTEFYRIVGLSIRDARRRRGISQQELATGAGLTRTSITNMERGRQKILLHTFCDIADILGTEPASLLPTAQAVEIPAKEFGKVSEQDRVFVENALKISKGEDQSETEKDPDAS